MSKRIDSPARLARRPVIRPESGAPKPEAESLDRAQLAALPQTFADAWNRHDAVALCRPFVEDADFVNVVGMWWHGRAQITEAHAKLHATIFSASKLWIDEVSVRLMTPDSAAIHACWSMIGHAKTVERWEPERRGILLLVAVRTAVGWAIAVAQNTDTDSAAALPDLVTYG